MQKIGGIKDGDHIWTPMGRIINTVEVVVEADLQSDMRFTLAANEQTLAEPGGDHRRVNVQAQGNFSGTE